MYLNVFHVKNDGKEFIDVWDDTLGYKRVPYQRYAYKLDENGQYKTVYGQKCKMVRRWSKEDVENGIIFESDIFPTTRYIIDNYLHNDEPSTKHRIMIIDIEVDTTNEKPNMQTANNEITSIAYYLYTKNMYCIHLYDPSEEITDYEYIENGDTHKVFSYKTEEEMLAGFLEKYKEYEPTIISGWYIDLFDMPYLYRRLKSIYGDDIANLLAHNDIVQWDDIRNRYFFGGVSCLDYHMLYKNKTLVQKEQISYTLENISMVELKQGKIKYDGNLDSLYKKNKQEFIKYNIQDVRLVKLLDDKLKFFELVMGICARCHVVLEDIPYSSRYLDGAILTYLKRQNKISPSRTKIDGNNINDNDDDENTSFEGAYVKSPQPGLYDWIIDTDATSLYPSIIRTLNISPETKYGKIKNWNEITEKYNLNL